MAFQMPLMTYSIRLRKSRVSFQFSCWENRSLALKASPGCSFLSLSLFHHWHHQSNPKSLSLFTLRKRVDRQKYSTGGKEPNGGKGEKLCLGRSIGPRRPVLGCRHHWGGRSLCSVSADSSYPFPSCVGYFSRVMFPASFLLPLHVLLNIGKFSHSQFPNRALLRTGQFFVVQDSESNKGQ